MKKRFVGIKKWNEAVETLNPGTRYHNGLDSWIFSSKYEAVPDYLKEEQRKGRVLFLKTPTPKL